MKLSKFVVVGGFIALLSLWGCQTGTYRWERPNTTENEFVRDWNLCQYEGLKNSHSVTSYNPYIGYYTTNNTGAIREQCMVVKGYRKIYVPPPKQSRKNSYNPNKS